MNSYISYILIMLLKYVEIQYNLAMKAYNGNKFWRYFH